MEAGTEDALVLHLYPEQRCGPELHSQRREWIQKLLEKSNHHRDHEERKGRTAGGEQQEQLLPGSWGLCLNIGPQIAGDGGYRKPESTVQMQGSGQQRNRATRMQRTKNDRGLRES